MNCIVKLFSTILLKAIISGNKQKVSESVQLNALFWTNRKSNSRRIQSEFKKNSKRIQKNVKKKSKISDHQLSMEQVQVAQCHMLPLILLAFILATFSMMPLTMQWCRLSRNNPSTNCQPKHQMIFQNRLLSQSLIHCLVIQNGIKAVVFQIGNGLDHVHASIQQSS